MFFHDLSDYVYVFVVFFCRMTYPGSSTWWIYGLSPGICLDPVRYGNYFPSCGPYTCLLTLLYKNKRLYLLLPKRKLPIEGLLTWKKRWSYLWKNKMLRHSSDEVRTFFKEALSHLIYIFPLIPENEGRQKVIPKSISGPFLEEPPKYVTVKVIR